MYACNYLRSVTVKGNLYLLVNKLIKISKAGISLYNNYSIALSLVS